MASIKISDFITCAINDSCDYIPFVRNTNGDGINWDVNNYKTLAGTFTASYALTASSVQTSSYSFTTSYSNFSNTASYALLSNTASCALNGGIIVVDVGNGSTVRCANNNRASGDYSIVAGGTLNVTSASYSGILGGQNNTIYNSNAFIIGSNLTSSCNNTTFVNNLNIQNGCGITLGGVCATSWPTGGSGSGVVVLGGGCCSTVRCGTNNSVTGIYSTIVGGCGNNVQSDYSGILGGVNNSTQGYSDAFIIGSNISASNSCTTFVNNICVFGTANLTASNSISASYATLSSNSVTSSYSVSSSYALNSTISNLANTSSFSILSGDVIGNTTNSTVQKIWNVPLSASAEIPTSGSALTYNGTMWIPYIKPTSVVIAPYITNILITNLGKQDDTFDLYHNNSKIVSFSSGWYTPGRTWEIQYVQNIGAYSMRFKNIPADPWIYGTVLESNTGPYSSLSLLTNNSGGTDWFMYFQSTTGIVVTTNTGTTYTWNGTNPLFINNSLSTINSSTNYVTYALQFNININNITTYKDVITLRNQTTNIVW